MELNVGQKITNFYIEREERAIKKGSVLRLEIETFLDSVSEIEGSISLLSMMQKDIFKIRFPNGTTGTIPVNRRMALLVYRGMRQHFCA